MERDFTQLLERKPFYRTKPGKQKNHLSLFKGEGSDGLRKGLTHDCGRRCTKKTRLSASFVDRLSRNRLSRARILIFWERLRFTRRQGEGKKKGGFREKCRHQFPKKQKKKLWLMGDNPRIIPSKWGVRKWGDAGGKRSASGWEKREVSSNLIWTGKRERWGSGLPEVFSSHN